MQILSSFLCGRYIPLLVLDIEMRDSSFRYIEDRRKTNFKGINHSYLLVLLFGFLFCLISSISLNLHNGYRSRSKAEKRPLSFFSLCLIRSKKEKVRKKARKRWRGEKKEKDGKRQNNKRKKRKIKRRRNEMEKESGFFSKPFDGTKAKAIKSSMTGWIVAWAKLYWGCISIRKAHVVNREVDTQLQSLCWHVSVMIIVNLTRSRPGSFCRFLKLIRASVL